jgi:hypothetical protein
MPFPYPLGRLEASIHDLVVAMVEQRSLVTVLQSSKMATEVVARIGSSGIRR